MKNYLFTVLSLLFFILLGCRTDITESVTEITPQKNTSRYFISRDQLENTYIQKKLDSLQSNLLKSSIKTTSKKGSNENNLDGRIILDKRILVVENNNKEKTYTFPVRNIKDSTSSLENLVIMPYKDSYRSYIVKYNVTSKEREKILKGEKVDNLLLKIELFDVDYNKLFLPKNFTNSSAKVTPKVFQFGCVKLIYTIHESDCSCHGEDWTSVEIDISNCYTSYEGDTGGEQGGGSGSGGGPGGGGSSGGGTSPIEEDASGFEEEYENTVTNFRNQLNSNQYAWFTNPANKYLGMDLAALYNQYNTPQTFNFLTSLIDNVINKPTNIIFLYQVKNFINLKGLNPSSIQIINTLKNNLNSNVINYGFSEWAFNDFIQNNQNFIYFSQYPEDLEKIFFKQINYNNPSEANQANLLAPAFTELLQARKTGGVNQVNIQNPLWSAIKEHMIQKLKDNLPDAIQYGRIIYEHAQTYFSQNPDDLNKVNEFVAYMKTEVMLNVPIELNPPQMKWTDVLICWLFEIGNFPINDSTGYTLPTIGFSGTAYTIVGNPNSLLPMRYLQAHKMKNGIPDPTSVAGLRKRAIEQIKNTGSISPLNDEWIFGTDATISTITKLDGLQFCLGSYITNVSIIVLGNQKYELTFVIKNKTGWQSGTRGLNDYNGNSTDDSVMPDKPRGQGIHLGGTIGETFGWKETVTVP